jgi:hypothetical protein
MIPSAVTPSTADNTGSGRRYAATPRGKGFGSSLSWRPGRAEQPGHRPLPIFNRGIMTQVTAYEGWAMLEVMGHRQLTGTGEHD